MVIRRNKAKAQQPAAPRAAVPPPPPPPKTDLEHDAYSNDFEVEELNEHLCCALCCEGLVPAVTFDCPGHHKVCQRCAQQLPNSGKQCPFCRTNCSVPSVDTAHTALIEFVIAHRRLARCNHCGQNVLVKDRASHLRGCPRLIMARSQSASTVGVSNGKGSNVTSDAAAAAATAMGSSSLLSSSTAPTDFNYLDQQQQQQQQQQQRQLSGSTVVAVSENHITRFLPFAKDCGVSQRKLRDLLDGLAKAGQTLTDERVTNTILTAMMDPSGGTEEDDLCGDEKAGGGSGSLGGGFELPPPKDAAGLAVTRTMTMTNTTPSTRNAGAGAMKATTNLANGVCVIEDADDDDDVEDVFGPATAVARVGTIKAASPTKKKTTSSEPMMTLMSRSAKKKSQHE